MTTQKIVTDLDQVLKPLGFVRNKATWNRPVGMFVDVLDLQISKSDDAATLNVGVLERSIYAECWGEELEEFVEEPNCTVRTRIGSLIDNTEKWWQIADTTTPENIASSVINFALPFFEKLHTFHGMSEWLTRSNVMTQKYPPPVIYLAILQHRLGNANEACAILSKLLGKTLGSWKVRIRGIAERLRCS